MVKYFSTRSVAMSRRKHKLGLDENLLSLGPTLTKMGFNVLTSSQGLKDKEINDWLKEKNVKVFFTKNGPDFDNFFNRKYILYWVALNREDSALAKLIECLMMKDFPQFTGIKDVTRKVTNEFTRVIGCKH